MREDITGRKFGYLTAIKDIGDIGLGRGHVWLCSCICGKEAGALVQYLLNGSKRSCGIDGHRYNRDETHIKGASTRLRAEYQSWRGALARCLDSENPGYKYYGGRGITICDRWRTFRAFYDDMGSRPPGYTLERINVNGNYEPDNCRWATKDDQRRNMRSSVYIKHKGKIGLLLDAPRSPGVSRQLAYGRLKLGWPVEKALITPPRNYGSILKKDVDTTD